MKKIKYLSLLVAIVCIWASSCNKQYNENVIGQGSNGSGGGTSSINWNWTGKAPFSCKHDGIVFNTDTTSIAPYDTLGGNILIDYEDLDGNDCLVAFTTAASSGNVYPALLTYTEPDTAFHGAGGVKIINNDATQIEGYFYGTVSYGANGLNSVAGKTIQITEGYFKVNKN